MTSQGELITWEESGLLGFHQKLANFVQQLQVYIDLGDDGMPIGYIDPTVIAECIPYVDEVDDITEEKYKQSYIPITYDEGMPCIEGTPIWERLDGETMPYYKIFKEYRDMKYISTITNGQDLRPVNTRSIAKLSEQMSTPGKYLTVLSKIYHWPFRCKAYDRQKERELILKRQREATDLESRHFIYATEILEQAMDYLKKNPTKLDPKVALQMVELGMKYGRISVGLLGDKPGNQAAAVHQTNIAIQNSTTHNEADQMLNINAGGGDNQGRGANGQSKVERQLQDSMKDQSTLVSILHVLNKSGALKTAVMDDTVVIIENIDDDDDDADYNDRDDVVIITDSTDSTDSIKSQNYDYDSTIDVTMNKPMVKPKLSNIEKDDSMTVVINKQDSKQAGSEVENSPRIIANSKPNGQGDEAGQLGDYFKRFGG